MSRAHLYMRIYIYNRSPLPKDPIFFYEHMLCHPKTPYFSIWSVTQRPLQVQFEQQLSFITDFVTYFEKTKKFEAI